MDTVIDVFEEVVGMPTSFLHVGESVGTLISLFEREEVGHGELESLRHSEIESWRAGEL